MTETLVLDIESALPVALNEKLGVGKIRGGSRSGKGVMFTTKIWKDSMQIFRTQCFTARAEEPKTKHQRYRVLITHRETLDIDALDKFILDGMQGPIYINDKQVYNRQTIKHKDQKLTRVQAWRIEP